MKVNFLDQLLVEGEPLDLEQLKDKAKNSHRHRRVRCPTLWGPKP